MTRLYAIAMHRTSQCSTGYVSNTVAISCSGELGHRSMTKASFNARVTNSGTLLHSNELSYSGLNVTPTNRLQNIASASPF